MPQIPPLPFANGSKRRELLVLIDAKRREFIAKLVCDLGKTIFVVGIASYLFEKFPIGVRIGLSVRRYLVLMFLSIPLIIITMALILMSIDRWNSPLPF